MDRDFKSCVVCDGPVVWCVAFMTMWDMLYVGLLLVRFVGRSGNSVDVLKGFGFFSMSIYAVVSLSVGIHFMRRNIALPVVNPRLLIIPFVLACRLDNGVMP